MRKRINKGASLGCDGKSLRNLQTVSINRKSTHGKNNEKSCTLHSATGYATISISGTKTARRLGGLHYQHRRLIAMPFMAFSFCAIDRTHGVSLPKTLTGAPYGNPQGLLFPMLQSANLYGVAHPLGGGVGFTTDNPNIGDSHE